MNTGYASWVYIIILIFIVVMSAGISSSIARDNWQKQTTERGLAIYCPLDGEWAWIGECSDE
jgi:hypothetical protein